MKIGIMGAMPEEVDTIREQMVDVSVVERGSRIYYEGKINGDEVVLVFSRWGKVAAATTSTSLITEFKIDQLIFTGVAGSVSPGLNIGDVVISTELYQHDMDPRPLFPKHEVPLTNRTFFEADCALAEKARSAVEIALASREEHIPFASLEAFRINSPTCYLGIVASGDQFIGDVKQTEAMLSDKPSTLAVEMEGASVAQVCGDYEIPFVIIRTISDKADHEASIDFPRFIKEVASHYSKQIIRNMF